MSFQKESVEKGGGWGGRRRRRGQSPLLPEVIGRLGAGCTRANLKSDYANSGSLPIFISVYRCWSERLRMTKGCQYSAS